MTYEIIVLYHLIGHIYCTFSISYLKSYPFGHTVPEEVRQLLLIRSFIIMRYAVLLWLLLILSIINMAFAVCIPKKIHRIFVFLFRALIFDSE